jgi:F0F1-type ATP synthase assembly protein I
MIAMRSRSDLLTSPERRAWESKEESFAIAEKAIDSMLITAVVLVAVFFSGALVGFAIGFFL